MCKSRSDGRETHSHGWQNFHSNLEASTRYVVISISLSLLGLHFTPKCVWLPNGRLVKIICYGLEVYVKRI